MSRLAEFMDGCNSSTTTFAGDRPLADGRSTEAVSTVKYDSHHWPGPTRPSSDTDDQRLHYISSMFVGWPLGLMLQTKRGLHLDTAPICCVRDVLEWHALDRDRLAEISIDCLFDVVDVRNESKAEQDAPLVTTANSATPPGNSGTGSPSQPGLLLCLAVFCYLVSSIFAT